MLFQPRDRHLAQSYPNGHFATWPSVTVANVRKYLSKSDATSKGHMNQIRQNIRSTQPAVEHPAPELDMVQEEKCNYIYAAVMETNQIYTYLTGRFPTTSLSGNKYILILYGYDSNSVLSAPMKNRGDKYMVRAFDLLIQSLIIRGLKPHLQRLDNEASLALRNYLTKQGINYQLARRIFTGGKMLRGKSKHSRTILFPGFVQWIQLFHSNYGTSSYLKRQ
jgi:hypothetical protein